MYKVICEFHDLQDYQETKAGKLYHLYKVGDEFPRPGKKVSQKRTDELACSDNLRGCPLIELVVANKEDTKEETETVETETVKEEPKKKRKTTKKKETL